jgi:hypothetical protein
MVAENPARGFLRLFRFRRVEASVAAVLISYLQGALPKGLPEILTFKTIRPPPERVAGDKTSIRL